MSFAAVLVGSRLLAVEGDWAAKEYARVDWRYVQARQWFHRQSLAMPVAVLFTLLAVALAIVWLLIREFG